MNHETLVALAVVLKMASGIPVEDRTNQEYCAYHVINDYLIAKAEKAVKRIHRDYLLEKADD